MRPSSLPYVHGNTEIPPGHQRLRVFTDRGELRGWVFVTDAQLAELRRSFQLYHSGGSSWTISAMHYPLEALWAPDGWNNQLHDAIERLLATPSFGDELTKILCGG